MTISVKLGDGDGETVSITLPNSEVDPNSCTHMILGGRLYRLIGDEWMDITYQRTCRRTPA